MSLHMPSLEHQSILNSLPGKIAHIYDNDSLDSHLKHDVVCRLIAKSIGANAVSILLYNGPTNKIYCAGRYIDPLLSKAKPVRGDKYGTAIVRLMKNIDIFEFLKINPEKFKKDISPGIIRDLYQDYINSYEFSNPVKSSFKIFSRLAQAYSTVERREKLEQEYTEYSKTIRSDTYPILSLNNPLRRNEISVTGTYYHALTHSKSISEFKSLLSPHSGIKIDPDYIIVAPLKGYLFPRISSKNLKTNLKVEIKSDALYIGIPLYANRRPIGILRLSLNNRLEVKIPISENNSLTEKSETYECSNHQEIIDYIKKTVNIQGLSYMLSLLINNLLYTDGMRDISLKDALKGKIDNLPEIANELVNIINCYGCLIRLSKGNGNEAEVKGYSESVKEYVDSIENKDPYITDKGTFMPVLISLLYNRTINSDTGDVVDIQCLKTDFDENNEPKFSYLYLDSKARLVYSDQWKGILNRDERIELKKIFKSSSDIFEDYDLKTIIHIPIKDQMFGFVTFANTSNRIFLTKDIEMLIPVVNRLGLALKYDSNIAKAEAMSKNEIRKGQRTIYHQLLSPIVSMRFSFKYLRRLGGNKGNIDIDKKHFDLRMQEIIDTLENTIDLVGMNQYFSSIGVDNEKIIPKLEKISISSFIIDKVRTYQVRAKLNRGLDIHVKNEDSKFPWIYTDQVLLSHIIQALLDNAIKYSFSHLTNEYSDKKNPIYPPGDEPNKIYVILEYFDNEYAISVENWGCKFSEKDEDKEGLKEYLRRGKNAKLFEENGTGIGLYLADIFANALNGKLEIYSDNTHTIITVRFKL